MSEISKTVDQALAVLQELADAGPLTPTEIAPRLGLNRTVVHRLLVTLHRRGFVARQEGGYTPGAAILRIAELVRPELRAAAVRVMSSLRDAVSETVLLYVPDGDESVVLHQSVATTHVLRVEHAIGSRSPLHRGCSGLSMLAFMSPGTIEWVARESQNPDHLFDRLATVRELGYSVTHDEIQEGVYGLGVPVLDQTQHAFASISVIMPVSRAARILDYVDPAKTAAEDVSAALQYGSTLVR